MTDRVRGLGGFGAGVHDAGRGLAFLGAHRRLWKWLLAPAAISAVLLAALATAVAVLATHVVGAMTSHLPAWLGDPASTLLMIVLVVILAAGALLVFATVAGLVAGPFCEQLSEAVEEILTGREAPSFSPGRFVREAAIGTTHTARRLLAALLGAALLFALSFVPVLGTLVALLLGGYSAARASAYDCYDAVLGRRRLAYHDKLAVLATYRARSLGLGAAVAGLLLVPGVNLVALGVGSVGATLALHDLDAAAAPAAGAMR